MPGASAGGGRGKERVVEILGRGTPVVVFSKTWCGFCARVKRLLKEEMGLGGGGVLEVVELDREEEEEAGLEEEMQRYLQEVTGARSVPRVFIGGRCVGGCDETLALHRQGKLAPMLKEAGAL